MAQINSTMFAQVEGSFLYEEAKNLSLKSQGWQGRSHNPTLV